MMKLPAHVIPYKGGVSIVSRMDEPTYQCTSCYKPWFNEDLDTGLYVYVAQCPNCASKLRKITREQPLITE